MKQIYEEIIRIETGSGQPAVLAMIVSAQDSSPRGAGSKMLVRMTGQIIGSIGGGAIEKIALETALEMLSRNTPTRLQQYDLTSGNAASIHTKTGMQCGGTVTVYFELVRPFDRLIIFGAGHIGTAIAPIAQACGFFISIVDDRPEFAHPDRFPPMVCVTCDHPVKFAQNLSIFPEDSIVILTHNHRYDADVLKAILSNDSGRPRYIGMIGSRKKVRVILDKMHESGIEDDSLNRVHSPIGLNIGGDNPTEIAVSIMAELMAVRAGKLSNDCIRTMRSSSE